MELFDLTSPVETLLVDKASALKQPIGGTMELLPLCNMDCKMCYVRQTKAQMEAQGRMLSCDEWLRIAEDARNNGVLFLLLTGGEPLLYPEFKRLYTALTDMGFVITINTNGTLIDEEWANLFGSRPCRRLNITLYGTDDKTYGELCRNPKGFSQIMRAVELLRERNVEFRFNCSLTPDNRTELMQIYEIAHRCETHIEVCSYMFPPARKVGGAERYVRMTPEEAAQSMLDSFVAKNPLVPLEIAVKNTLARVGRQPDLRHLEGLSCRAGRSGFWMNWKGELLPCGMFSEPKISLLEHSFNDCWKYIVEETSKLKRCAECDACDLRNLCKTCGAACLTETGRTDGKPEYLCQMTKECYRLLLTYVRPEDQAEYRRLMEE